MAINAIETPVSVQRKIDFLRNAFSQLVASFPDDSALLQHARDYDTWHNDITTSLTSKLFTSGTAAEFDVWQALYISDYKRLLGANPETITGAPKPEVIEASETDNTKTSPWIWAIIAGSIGIGLASIAIIRRK